MSIQKRFIKTSVAGVLKTTAWLARRERLNVFTALAMRGLAALVIRIKGIRQAGSVEELGKAWQRGFPSAKEVPITEVDASTVYAEIRTPCPLRGTGDVHACYRMMEFDRAVVKQAGGQFVVLKSQATPGRTYCEVAMRPAGVPTDDLVPAHETVKR